MDLERSAGQYLERLVRWISVGEIDEIDQISALFKAHGTWGALSSAGRACLVTAARLP